MKVLVTGATGFLGKRVVRELVAAGYHTRCLVRSADKAGALMRHLPSDAGQRVELVNGVLHDSRSCAEMLQGCETVVHVAAPLAGSTPALFLGGVVPTRVLVEAALEQGMKRFVLISSLGVYGTSHLSVGSVLDEGCPLDALPHRRDPYTYAKIEQEQICWQAYRERGLPLVVVRPGVLFGGERGFLSNRIGLRIGNVMVRMGGRQRVPYSYVENCAQAIARAVATPSIEGQAFNIVDDDLPTARQLVRVYKKRVGPLRVVGVPGWAVNIGAKMAEAYFKRSSGLFPAVITPYKASAQWKPLRYSNARAKQVLSWQPATPFAAALDATISALSQKATIGTSR